MSDKGEDLKSFSFDQLNITDVPWKPTPTKLSRDVATRCQKFLDAHSVNGTITDLKNDDAAAFLIEVSHMLLRQHYPVCTTIPATQEEFEVKATFQEVLDFLYGQIKTNGPRDFLVAPLGTLLENMWQVAAQPVDIVSPPPA